ncbi:hypothetical protein T11_3979 [Trichinella zimbabwensis]|uniref:Uncharacterized protein n=1 Tax=Trichinella zimbabwensis TaxID=268475 RepID=A0A0V1HPC2_9BILA|nr:hypothetical protein T11_3979 [Trichinella zimbabwensis]
MKVSHQWLQPRYRLYNENPQTLDIVKYEKVVFSCLFYQPQKWTEFRSAIWAYLTKRKSPMSLIKTLSALFINKPHLIPGISKLMPKGCRIRSIEGNTFVFFPGVSTPSVLLKKEILKESKRLFMRKYLQEKLSHYFYRC